MMFDSQGWVFVYYVVFFNYVDCFLYLIYYEFKLMELKLIDYLQFILIFLVVFSGVFDVVKCFIEKGVQYTFIDKEGNGVVYFVVFYFYINILEYFISWNNIDVFVWDFLVGMLKLDDFKRKYSVVRCFEVFFLVVENNWKLILWVGGVLVFVNFLRIDNVEFQLLVVLVLCNIGFYVEVRVEVFKVNVIFVVISLLSLFVFMIYLRVVVIFGDLVCIDLN